MTNPCCPTNSLLCKKPVQSEFTPIEHTTYPPGHKWDIKLFHCEIIFVLKGNLTISFDFFLDKTIETGNILLLPPGNQIKAETEEGISLLIMRLKESVSFCNGFSLEDLTDSKVTPSEDPAVLIIRPILQSYLSLLIEIIKGGFNCNDYLNIKIREFLFLLKAYYSTEELAKFFYSFINGDASFAQFVFRNYRKMKTVQEFAALYSSSISSFDKRFRRTFGCSTYQWMMKRKIEIIYHEINTTDKPFRQIAEESGFLSHSQFTDFCKKHLGDAPCRLRKKSNIMNQNNKK